MLDVIIYTNYFKFRDKKGIRQTSVMNVCLTIIFLSVGRYSTLQ